MQTYAHRLTPTNQHDAALIARMWAVWFHAAPTSARMGEPVAFVARITAR